VHLSNVCGLLQKHFSHYTSFPVGSDQPVRSEQFLITVLIFVMEKYPILLLLQLLHVSAEAKLAQAGLADFCAESLLYFEVSGASLS
jgi:hypothetical protein